jgi:hypothetical protein
MCASEHCGLARRRGEAEQFAGFGAAETVLPGGEGVQGSGKVLAKQRAELVGDLLPVPGGVLLGTGQDCDGAGQVAVVGQRAVGVHVRAQDVGQDEGVAGVGLLAGDPVPVAIAGCREGVDGEDLPVTSAEYRDKQPAGRLDRHRDRGLFGVTVLGE